MGTVRELQWHRGEEMSITHHPASGNEKHGREQPGAGTPLLSQAGRDFLDGDIDAEHYMAQRRLRAIEKAKQEITAQSRERSRYIPLGAIGIAVGYLALSVVSFSARGIGLGAVALLTGGVFAIWSLIWWRKN
jgi:hypothetical protein